MSTAEAEKILPGFTQRDDELEYDFDPTKAGISDAWIGVASFLDSGQLYQILVVSNEYENDPYGLRIKTRMEEISKALNRRYGRWESGSYIADGYESEFFVLGVKSGRSLYGYDWDLTGLKVSLSITGSVGNNLRWALMYTEKEGEQHVKAAERDKERSAF